jgi:hypothetical protein
MKKVILLVILAVLGIAPVFSQDTVDINSFGIIDGLYLDSIPKVPQRATDLIGVPGCSIAVAVSPNKGMWIYGIAAPVWNYKESCSDSLLYEIWHHPESAHYGVSPTDTTYDDCFEFFQFYKKTASYGNHFDTVEFSVLEQGMVHVLDSNIIGYFDCGDVPWTSRRYVPIRAIYFEHPIYVSDTFYIGMTNYNEVTNRTWPFSMLVYRFPEPQTSPQHSYWKMDCSGNRWLANHSNWTPLFPFTYYIDYFYIFPLVDSVPMYPSPLVTGGGMAGAPVVTVDDFVSVSPNPATGMATVKSSFGINAVELYDLGGALLLSQAASGLCHTLDLRPYAAGVYILKVRTLNGTATKKIVKQ